MFDVAMYILKFENQFHCILVRKHFEIYFDSTLVEFVRKEYGEEHCSGRVCFPAF